MPTRHGWTTLGAAVVAFVVGRLFGLLELYVVGTALACVLLASVVLVNRRLPRMQVRRIARPSMVSVGEPARVDIQVANLAQRSTPRLRLWEPVGARGGAPMQLAPLPPGDVATAAYRVPSANRGVLRIGPLRAERTDPLGLCSRTDILAGSGEVLVVPERIPLAFPGLSSNGRLGEHLRMKSWGQTGTEFHSQREYVPGDDLRRINWKSSARAGELIVRETAVEGVRRCVVVLDTMASVYDPDAFERAVVAAASVVAGAMAMGIATRLVAPGIDLRGPEVAHESLRWLATVQAGTELVDHTASGRTHSDGLGLLVLVTGSTGSPAAVAARAAAAPDESLVMITTTEPPHTGGRFVVDGTSLTAMQHGWNQLVLGTASVTV
ncbi:MAG: hypothetical protein RJA49_2361 [Actinomycetota bacterium]